jgi:general secretion pathway protein F
VVAAGEPAVRSARCSSRLADDLEERQALRAKLIGAMLYPAIISVIAMLIVAFLVTYVVPQVANVFTSSRRSLPFLTVMLLAFSSFVRQWGWAGARWHWPGCSTFGWLRRGEAFRERSDAMLLRLPLAGRLARGYNAARFGATLAMLAGAGVPILKALQAAAETLGNRAMRADALDALVQVREGAPLASALASKPRFPGLLAMFARLGEQTGTLPRMLQRARDADVGRGAAPRLAAATLLEPLLVVAMGVVVLVIVLAVLLPIIQLNTWVR